MSFLIDTNIISEVRKGDRCDPAVAAWWARADEDAFWFSVLVIGEIRKGIDASRRRDPHKALMFEKWLAELVVTFGARILPVDRVIAEEWGRLMAIRSVPVTDALLVATAKTHGLTLVTRNVADVAGLGVKVLNPFEHA